MQLTVLNGGRYSWLILSRPQREIINGTSTCKSLIRIWSSTKRRVWESGMKGGECSQEGHALSSLIKVGGCILILIP
jgi:hypothetical protein